MMDNDALISAYLDDCLSPQEVQAFFERVATDRQLAAKLAELSLLEVHLRDQLRFELAQAPGAEGELERRSHKVSTKSVSQWAARAARYIARPTPLSLCVAACALGLMLAVLAIVSAPNFPARHGANDLQPLGEVVARLAYTEDVQWAAGAVELTRGALLRSNQVLDLDAGLATIAFDNGARVTIEGPTKLRLVSANAARLENGNLLAHVPAKSKGYQVLVGEIIVTDRGTRFSVAAADEHADVEVFEGRVDVTASTDVAAPPTVLCTGMAARFSPAVKVVELRASNERQFAAQTALLDRRFQSSGQIRFVSAPPSLASGSLESNDHAHLILERESVALSQDVNALLVEPAVKGNATLHLGALAAGTRVDSYLVHFDIVEKLLTDPDQKITCRGVIQFEQPILAILLNDDQLAKTDAELGSSATSYDSGPTERKSRGLERDRFDQLSISADRRTLHISCVLALPVIDQVRILVAAEEP